MVTKAVSDQFGKGGIADQMIRFNGFPFLDKEDHQFNESGELAFVFSMDLVRRGWLLNRAINFSLACYEAQRAVDTGDGSALGGYK